MNNRSPFIPNIPTPQGHWGDPSQIFNPNGSNSSNSQSNGQQVPFTAHQQMQLQSQQHNQPPMYGFTTSAPNLSTIPLQTNTATLFDHWSGTGMGNININSQMNYSYQLNQQVNSYHQQQLQQQQLAGAAQQVMHNIVNQPRGVQLTLDNTHFVHIPVNLSPQSGSAPSLSFNSRSTSSSGQFSPRNSGSNSRSNFSAQYHVSPSSSPGLPLSLDSRSLNAGSMESMYINSSGLPLSLNSRTSGNMSNNNSSNNSNNPVYLPILNLNSTSRMSSTPVSYSSSPPACLQRSPSSMSPFSGSSSPSPTPQMMNTGNMRLPPASSFINTSSTPVPFNQSSPGRMNRLPQNSSSPTPPPPTSSMGIQQQYFNARITEPQVQAPPPAHGMSYTPQQQRSSPSPNVRSSGNLVQQQTQAHSNLHFNQQQQQQQQHKPPTPPPKIKKPRAPRKKKEPPMKPIPINPSSNQPQPAPTLPPHLANLLPNAWASHHMLNVPVTAHMSSHGTSVGRGGTNTYTVPINQATSITYSVAHPPILQPSGMTSSYSQPSPLPPLTRPALVTSHTNPRMATAAPPPPPQSVIRSSSSVIQTLPNQPVTSAVRTPNQTISHRPTPPPPSSSSTSPQRRANCTSPVKNANNAGKLSVLDYALQRAGIPSNLNSGAKPDDAFGEAEIMRLVGVSDQSQVNKKLDAADTRSAGDFDLESELNRFYSPPSPTKDNQAQAKTTTTLSTQVSTLSTSTPSTTTTSTSNVVSTPSTSTARSATSSQSITTTPKTQSSLMTAKPKPVSDDDDDDCEVILVKLSDKKKRKMPVRRSVPQKKGQAQTPVQLQGRPNLTLSVSKGAAAGRQESKSSKALSRPAYPNGRYVEVAPKTTVPIPAKTATARKSTAPIPVLVSKGKNARQQPKTQSQHSRTTTSTNSRSRRSVMEVEDYYEEPVQPKMTRLQARALQNRTGQSVPQPVAVIISSLTTADTNPPIKMKLNLKAGTAKNVHNTPITPSGKRPGPRSKTKVAPRSSVERKSLGTEEDDLLIVDEFLADSDDSYDPLGERDEASSESETEDEEGGYSPSAKKRKQGSEKGTFDPTIKKKKPPPKIEDEDETEVTKPTPTTTEDNEPSVVSTPVVKEVIKSEPLPPPEAEEEDGMHFTTPFDDDFDDDSPTSSFSPPSPPFKNYVQEPEKEEEPQIIPEPVLTPQQQPIATNGKNESEESDEEEEEVEQVEQKFEMPKPKVIIKGTKQDADKALNDMRQALAQLTKFKMPFFGKK